MPEPNSHPSLSIDKSSVTECCSLFNGDFSSRQQTEPVVYSEPYNYTFQQPWPLGNILNYGEGQVGSCFISSIFVDKLGYINSHVLIKLIELSFKMTRISLCFLSISSVARVFLHMSGLDALFTSFDVLL